VCVWVCVSSVVMPRHMFWGPWVPSSVPKAVQCLSHYLLLCSEAI